MCSRTYLQFERIFCLWLTRITPNSRIFSFLSEKIWSFLYRDDQSYCTGRYFDANILGPRKQKSQLAAESNWTGKAVLTTYTQTHAPRKQISFCDAQRFCTDYAADHPTYQFIPLTPCCPLSFCLSPSFSHAHYRSMPFIKMHTHAHKHTHVPVRESLRPRQICQARCRHPFDLPLSLFFRPDPASFICHRNDRRASQILHQIPALFLEKFKDMVL